MELRFFAAGSVSFRSRRSRRFSHHVAQLLQVVPSARTTESESAVDLLDVFLRGLRVLLLPYLVANLSQGSTRFLGATIRLDRRGDSFGWWNCDRTRRSAYGLLDAEIRIKGRKIC